MVKIKTEKSDIIKTNDPIATISKIFLKRGTRLGFMVYVEEGEIGLITGDMIKEEDLGLIRLLIAELFFK